MLFGSVDPGVLRKDNEGAGMKKLALLICNNYLTPKYVIDKFPLDEEGSIVKQQ